MHTGPYHTNGSSDKKPRGFYQACIRTALTSVHIKQQHTPSVHLIRKTIGVKRPRYVTGGSSEFEKFEKLESFYFLSVVNRSLTKFSDTTFFNYTCYINKAWRSKLFRRLDVSLNINLIWDIRDSFSEVESQQFILTYYIPDSKVHGANMGPIWDRQDLVISKIRISISSWLLQNLDAIIVNKSNLYFTHLGKYIIYSQLYHTCYSLAPNHSAILSGSWCRQLST